MAISLETLSNASLTATTLSNLVLVSPQKNIGIKPTQQGNAAQSLNVPSLLFHIEAENSANLRSGITDHYVEDNTAINDHISLMPETVSVNGFIGELNNVVPEILQALKIAADKLTIISAYTPSLSASAIVAYNNAEQLYRATMNTLEAGVASWNTINNSKLGTTTGQLNQIGSTGLVTDNGNQTKQQKAFQQFYGYWRNKALFTVQTPWAIFQDMAIEDMKAVQDPDTNMVTDFTIKFKIFRFAKTGRETFFEAQGRHSNQMSVETVKGNGSTSPAPSLNSFLGR